MPQMTTGVRAQFCLVGKNKFALIFNKTQIFNKTRILSKKIIITIKVALLNK